MKSESRWDALVNLLLPLALILGLVFLLTTDAGSSATPPATEINALETGVNRLVGYLAAGAEVSAAIVIGGAVVRGIVDYLRQLVMRDRQHFDATESIRLKLGRVLALGLEFSVASDILRTAITPHRQGIVNLGAIVLLRTLLNYFLEQEIRQGEERRNTYHPTYALRER